MQRASSEADTQMQEGKYQTIKVLRGSILKLLLQSIQCPSFTGWAICNLPYFYHSSPLPPYHHMGFNLPTHRCPVISVHTQFITSMCRVPFFPRTGKRKHAQPLNCHQSRLFETVPGRTVVKTTEHRFWSHDGQNHHLLTRRSKRPNRNFRLWGSKNG